MTRRECEAFALADEKTRLRFYSKVIDGPKCWSWSGSFSAQKRFPGYGQFGVGGRNGAICHAHRLMWIYANGRTIPPGAFVTHMCDNSRCVNPGHLRLGDYVSNALEASMRGRTANQHGRCPDWVNAGERARNRTRRKHTALLVAQLES